jgi:hypothetical protein
MGSDPSENKKREPFDVRRRAIPPHGGRTRTRTSLIEPATCAAGTGRPRADSGRPVESHPRKEPPMTRHETRKTRSGRRARIETEFLESRKLLSTLAKCTPAVLAADLDAKRVAEVALHTEIKIAPQSSFVVDVKQVGTQIVIEGKMTPQAKLSTDIKVAPQAKLIAIQKVPGSRFVVEGKMTPQAKLTTNGKIAPQAGTSLYPPVPAATGPYQTSVWSGAASSSDMKKV